MKKHLRKSGLFLLLALAGCTHSISNIDATGKTASPVFPEISKAVKGEGSYTTLETISRVKPGLTKANVYDLVGVPHFKEGVFGVKEWDYILHFRSDNQREVTCQYKVIYDSDLKVGSTYFKPENCLSLLKDASGKQTYAKEIGAEALFAFSSARLNTDGIAAIQRVANELRAMDLKGRTINITGHTDRIGQSGDNYRLSLQRAAAVKNMLEQNGIPSSAIRINGMGETMPRVVCEGAKSFAVVQCLAPNRRITIEVI